MFIKFSNSTTDKSENVVLGCMKSLDAISLNLQIFVDPLCINFEFCLAVRDATYSLPPTRAKVDAPPLETRRVEAMLGKVW